MQEKRKALRDTELLLGAEGDLGDGGEPPLFVPMPPFMTTAGGPRGPLSFALPFVFRLLFPWFTSHILGTGLGGGQNGKVATCRHRGREKRVKIYAAMI